MDDILVWPLAQTGICSSLKNSLEEDIGPKGSNKVKNLLWRACRNSIPAETNLVRHMVISKDSCDHCHSASEDVLHAVWLYPVLSTV